MSLAVMKERAILLPYMKATTYVLISLICLLVMYALALFLHESPCCKIYFNLINYKNVHPDRKAGYKPYGFGNYSTAVCILSKSLAQYTAY